MENASKALIMAAGILIGVIVMTIFAYEMVQVANTSQSHEDALAITQVLEFNSQFEIYQDDETGVNPRHLTAQEVATLYNFVYQWNMANGGHPDDIVNVNIPNATLRLNYIDSTTKRLDTEKFLLEYAKYKRKTNGEVVPRYYFTCTDYKYEGFNGRISSITINLKENL